MPRWSAHVKTPRAVPSYPARGLSRAKASLSPSVAAAECLLPGVESSSRMSDLPHLRIASNQTAENYTYAGGTPQNVVFERPPRNKPAHGPQVRAQLEGAQAQAVQQRAASRVDHPQLVQWQSEGVNL